MSNRAYRVNDRIRASRVRVIDPEGAQLGVMATPQAREAAERYHLDLIEVAPEADPPVCRIMDYGKFRYEAQKKTKDAAKKSKQTELKGIRVRPNTDDHDLSFKIKNAIKFLEKGNMVKFNVIFRGPELRHKEVGQAQLNAFIEATKDVADVEVAPRMEGRQMLMVLRPKAEAVKKAAKAAASKAHEASLAASSPAPAPAAPAAEGEPVAPPAASPEPVAEPPAAETPVAETPVAETPVAPAPEASVPAE
ncbi:MAG TPA: translation initiation factor IF-3 [Armatimonadota bacterium]